MPAAASGSASLSGVWPPSCTITPHKVPALASTLAISKTSSAVKGSK